MNLKPLLTHILTFGAGVLTVAQVQAAVLAEYAFDSSSLVSTDADANSTASDFDLSVEGDIWGAQGLLAPSVFYQYNEIGNNESGALSGNDYFGFTITPGAGVELSFDNISFDVRTNTGGAAELHLALYSSIDGFASTADRIALQVDISTGNTFVNGTPFDLSASQFQNITTAVEFRLYLYDGGATGAAFTGVDNVTLNGTSAVIPEPSTYALAFGALGLVIAAARRRRR